MRIPARPSNVHHHGRHRRYPGLIPAAAVGHRADPPTRSPPVPNMLSRTTFGQCFHTSALKQIAEQGDCPRIGRVYGNAPALPGRPIRAQVHRAGSGGRRPAFRRRPGSRRRRSRSRQPPLRPGGPRHQGRCPPPHRHTDTGYHFRARNIRLADRAPIAQLVELRTFNPQVIAVLPAQMIVSGGSLGAGKAGVTLLKQESAPPRVALDLKAQTAESAGVRLDAPPTESAPTRARTWDPLIKSQLLYQLSYRGSARTEYNTAPACPQPDKGGTDGMG